MLPKKYRLPSQMVSRVLKTGKRLSSPLFQILYLDNDIAYSRFACIVGTAVEKRAAKRNRIKRLLREAIDHLFPKIKPGLDVVIIAKHNCAKSNREDVEKLLQNTTILQ